MKKGGNRNFFYIDVDGELVIRNLIFLVLFCVIIGTSINYFLWPMIEAYKEQHLEEKKIKVVFLQVQKDYENNLVLLKKTKKSNQKFLDVMSYEFPISELKSGLSKYFKNIEITKKSTQEDEENQFRTDVYFVRGEIESVQAMNDFFTQLQNASMSIQVHLPVIIKKSQNSDNLILQFYIDIEKSNYKPEIEL